MVVIAVFLIICVSPTAQTQNTKLRANSKPRERGICPAATCTEDNHCVSDKYSNRPCCINGKCQEFKLIKIGESCVHGDPCKYGNCMWPSVCYKSTCSVIIKPVGCKCRGHEDCLAGVCGSEGLCLDINLVAGETCTENRQCKQGVCKEGICTWLHAGDDCTKCAGYTGYTCCFDSVCDRKKDDSTCKAFKNAGEVCEPFGHPPCSPYAPHCVFDGLNKKKKVCMALHSRPDGASCGANSECDITSFCYVEEPEDQCKNILATHGKEACERISFCFYDPPAEECRKNSHGYYAWAFDAAYYGPDYFSYRETAIKAHCHRNHKNKPGDSCIYNEECNTGYCVSEMCKERLQVKNGDDCLFHDDCGSGFCNGRECTPSEGRTCKSDKDCGLHRCLCDTNKCDTEALDPKIVNEVAYMTPGRDQKYWMDFLTDLGECGHSYIRALPVWLRLKNSLNTSKLTESEKRFIVDAECCQRCRGKKLGHQKFKHPFYTVDCQKKTLKQEDQCADIWPIFHKTMIGCDEYSMEEHAINNCDLLALDKVTCGNHGECQHGECICKDGYRGNLCQIPSGMHVCAAVMCLHGGVCDSSSGKCICPYGYMGVHCGFPIDLLINMKDIAKDAIKAADDTPRLNVFLGGLGLSIVLAGLFFFFRSNFFSRNKNN